MIVVVIACTCMREYEKENGEINTRKIISLARIANIVALSTTLCYYAYEPLHIQLVKLMQGPRSVDNEAF